MALVIGVRTEKIEGLDVLRERLGDSGNIRSEVTPMLRRAARLGAEAARREASKGATGRLVDAIADDAIQFRVRGDVAAARFGVQPVPNPGRGDRFYPLAVHEGTGMFGRLHRIITPRRAKVMVFPGGGKPWPVRSGATGNVRKFAVRGQRANPYMTRGFEEAAAYVEAHLDEMINDIVG